LLVSLAKRHQLRRQTLVDGFILGLLLFSAFATELDLELATTFVQD
jgi:hypothetical protein